MAHGLSRCERRTREDVKKYSLNMLGVNTLPHFGGTELVIHGSRFSVSRCMNSQNRQPAPVSCPAGMTWEDAMQINEVTILYYDGTS